MKIYLIICIILLFLGVGLFFYGLIPSEQLFIQDVPPIKLEPIIIP